MSVSNGIWDALARVATFLLFLAGLLLVAMWYLPLIEQNRNMRQRISELDGKIVKAEDRSKQLRGSIEALRRDPKAVERLVRQNLSLARPGETVVRFEPPVTNVAPRTPLR